jgi:hypothetical protein
MIPTLFAAVIETILRFEVLLQILRTFGAGILEPFAFYFQVVSLICLDELGLNNFSQFTTICGLWEELDFVYSARF